MTALRALARLLTRAADRLCTPTGITAEDAALLAQADAGGAR